MYVAANTLGFESKTNRLMTMRIIATSVGMPRAPRKETLPIYLDWEDLIGEFSATAPNGLQNVFQTAGI